MTLRNHLVGTAGVEQVLGPPPSQLAEPEMVVLRLRSHGRRLLWPVLALVGIAAAAGYWVGNLPQLWMNLLAALGATMLGLLLGLLPIVAWLAHRTTITSHRVIVRRGLLVRQRSEVQLSRVREVRTTRTPGQRMWGSGDVELMVGSEGVVLHDLAGAEGTAEALRELMERNYAHSTRVQQSFFGSL